MSSLERKLAKAKVASRVDAESSAARSEVEEPELYYPWPREAWVAAQQAYANGYRRPQIRFPVIITPDGPVSSPERLRQLAELDALPETIETTQIDWHDVEIKKVLISHVSFSELGRVRAKAEVLLGIAEETCVLFRGKKRYAAVVKALNEGVTLTG